MVGGKRPRRAVARPSPGAPTGVSPAKSASKRSRLVVEPRDESLTGVTLNFDGVETRGVPEYEKEVGEVVEMLVSQVEQDAAERANRRYWSTRGLYSSRDVAAGTPDSPIAGEMIRSHVEALMAIIVEQALLKPLTRDENSLGIFVDLGSGRNGVALHYGFRTDEQLSFDALLGCEIDPIRWRQALSIQANMLRSGAEMRRASMKCINFHADAVDMGFILQTATVVYHFNKGFEPASMKEILKLLNKSRTVQVYISYYKEATLREYGMSTHFVQVESLCSPQRGGSASHTAYVFRRRRKREPQSVVNLRHVLVPVRPEEDPFDWRKTAFGNQTTYCDAFLYFSDGNLDTWVHSQLSGFRDAKAAPTRARNLAASRKHETASTGGGMPDAASFECCPSQSQGGNVRGTQRKAAEKQLPSPSLKRALPPVASSSTPNDGVAKKATTAPKKKVTSHGRQQTVPSSANCETRCAIVLKAFPVEIYRKYLQNKYCLPGVLSLKPDSIEIKMSGILGGEIIDFAGILDVMYCGRRNPKRKRPKTFDDLSNVKVVFILRRIQLHFAESSTLNREEQISSYAIANMPYVDADGAAQGKTVLIEKYFARKEDADSFVLAYVLAALYDIHGEGRCLHMQDSGSIGASQVRSRDDLFHSMLTLTGTKTMSFARHKSAVAFDFQASEIIPQLCPFFNNGATGQRTFTPAYIDGILDKKAAIEEQLRIDLEEYRRVPAQRDAADYLPLDPLFVRREMLEAERFNLRLEVDDVRSKLVAERDKRQRFQRRCGELNVESQGLVQQLLKAKKALGRLRLKTASLQSENEHLNSENKSKIRLVNDYEIALRRQKETVKTRIETARLGAKESFERTLELLKRDLHQQMRNLYRDEIKQLRSALDVESAKAESAHAKQLAAEASNAELRDALDELQTKARSLEGELRDAQESNEALTALLQNAHGAQIRPQRTFDATKNVNRALSESTAAERREATPDACMGGHQGWRALGDEADRAFRQHFRIPRSEASSELLAKYFLYAVCGNFGKGSVTRGSRLKAVLRTLELPVYPDSRDVVSLAVSTGVPMRYPDGDNPDLKDLKAYISARMNIASMDQMKDDTIRKLAKRLHDASSPFEIVQEERGRLLNNMIWRQRTPTVKMLLEHRFVKAERERNHPGLIACGQTLKGQTVNSLDLLTIYRCNPSLKDIYDFNSEMLDAAHQVGCEFEPVIFSETNLAARGVEAYKLSKSGLDGLLIDFAYNIQTYSKTKLTPSEGEQRIVNRIVIFRTGDGAKSAGSRYVHSVALHPADLFYMAFGNGKLQSVKFFSVFGFACSGMSKHSNVEAAEVLYDVYAEAFAYLGSFAVKEVQLEGRKYYLDFSSLKKYAADMKELQQMAAITKAPPAILFAGCCNLPYALYTVMWTCPETGKKQLLAKSRWVVENFDSAPLPAPVEEKPADSIFRRLEAYQHSPEGFPSPLTTVNGLNHPRFGLKKDLRVVDYKNVLTRDDQSKFSREEQERRHLARHLRALGTHATDENFKMLLEVAIGFRKVCKAAVARNAFDARAPNLDKKSWLKQWTAESTSDAVRQSLWAMLCNALAQGFEEIELPKPDSNGATHKIKRLRNKSLNKAATDLILGAIKSVATNHHLDILVLQQTLGSPEFQEKLPIYLRDRAVALETMGYSVSEALKLNVPTQTLLLTHIVDMETITLIRKCRQIRLSHKCKHRLVSVENLLYDLLLHGKGSICAGLLHDLIATPLKRAGFNAKDAEEFYEEAVRVLHVHGIKKTLFETFDFVKGLSSNRAKFSRFFSEHAELFINKAYDFYDRWQERQPDGRDPGRALPSREDALSLLADMKSWLKMLSDPGVENLTDEGRRYTDEHCVRAEQAFTEIYERVIQLYSSGCALGRRLYTHVCLCHLSRLMKDSGLLTMTCQEGAESLMKFLQKLYNASQGGGGSRVAAGTEGAKGGTDRHGRKFFSKRITAAYNLKQFLERLMFIRSRHFWSWALVRFPPDLTDGCTNALQFFEKHGLGKYFFPESKATGELKRSSVRRRCKVKNTPLWTPEKYGEILGSVVLEAEENINNESDDESGDEDMFDPLIADDDFEVADDLEHSGRENFRDAESREDREENFEATMILQRLGESSSSDDESDEEESDDDD